MLQVFPDFNVQKKYPYQESQKCEFLDQRKNLNIKFGHINKKIHCKKKQADYPENKKLSVTVFIPIYSAASSMLIYFSFSDTILSLL